MISRETWDYARKRFPGDMTHAESSLIHALGQAMQALADCSACLLRANNTQCPRAEELLNIWNGIKPEFSESYRRLDNM